MKLTKQRLKEIIKEEVASIRESDIDDWGYMPPREPGSWPRPRDMQTEPKFTGGSPEQDMVTHIEARKILAGLSEEEMAKFVNGLDADAAMALKKLLDIRMYDSSGMEEAMGRKSKTTKTPKDPKPSETKAANKRNRAQSKRKIKKGED